MNEVPEAVDALFVSAHPDDVEIFCGATVARLATSGARVMIADLSAGELASNGTAEGRRSDSLRAAGVLGALAERPVLDIADGTIDAQDEAQVRALVRLIRRTRPVLLVGPYWYDRHPDHEQAGKLLRRAAFFAGVTRFADDLSLPAHRPARVLHYPCHQDVDVQVIVDVTESMEAWEAAVRCYGSQFDRGQGDRPTFINRPGFVEAHVGRRRHVGSLAQLEFAEGFVHEGPWLASVDSILADPGRGEAS